MPHFKLVSQFKPRGDQIKAIQDLTNGLQQEHKNQVLLGCTGSGKTFTIANVINNVQRPTLIMAHNKTLAMQLYEEMKGFFPHNSVEYFVSYYDYYQPEAYIAKSDTYIEKESSINEQIDRMRHSATRAILEKKDVIIIASVSCIYGIGDVDTYGNSILDLSLGDTIPIRNISKNLVKLQYKRNNTVIDRGNFRVSGDTLDIFPSHSENRMWRISFFGDEVEEITEIDPLTNKTHGNLNNIRVYPNSHHVTTSLSVNQALQTIQAELQERLKDFKENGKLIEAQRLEERVNFDTEMLKMTGFCSGIENYSRHFTDRLAGNPPPTLFEYLPKEALLVVDESHISVPQIRGMFNGDRSRKNNLSGYGFRLPSCVDNRPLKFEEWNTMRPDTIFLSATPNQWEISEANDKVIEQIIRPTGLVDPICTIFPTKYQIDELIIQATKVIKSGHRVLVTTLTKKMAEELASYLQESNLNAQYLHCGIKTLERADLIQAFRKGDFDILIGINLLREGLDLPECGLVAILDADKEGFLRSYTSLIQTIGRAARNAQGEVILFADNITKSIKQALDETYRRRKIQISHNQKHGIVPETTVRNFTNNFAVPTPIKGNIKKIQKQINILEKEMYKFADNMDFEKAAKTRDEIKILNHSIGLS